MTLNITWEDFTSKIEKSLIQHEDLEKQFPVVKNETDLNVLLDKTKEWATGVKEIIENSFIPANQIEGREFFHSGHQRFNIPNAKKLFDQLKKEALEDFKTKNNFLSNLIRIYSIADAIVRPDKIDLVKRAKLDTHERLELILEKLYELRDGRYYDVAFILESNGIAIQYGEEREYVKMLEDNGLVNAMHIRRVSASITLNGRIFVEEKRRTYIEDYSSIDDNAAVINANIDEILDKLTKLGYGQEIIFNEIEELKELHKTLNKKTFGQVVKGKIVDLALAKLLENDTLEYIYEKLTHHHLRLP
ncbi:hypothetical protein AQ505_08790 [Pedobacter sp. PACM 27299]|uniref:hypothetical protein n=1 Tax=Pedobacter sp. PACM 27299 TaxID=1727164 RepID=UPI0007064004|nr:hypothetical protein [Pedobacter sp. PACM 27299]ALL05578.1 hypothetical protein AQ505_08790 [Pedobacter sp. PACM 27299]